MPDERFDIADILRHYGAQPAAEGGWRKLRCPFHDDRTASAACNRELGEFMCHACDARGDGVGLVMQQEGLGYRDALNFARTIAAGVTRTRNPPQQGSLIPRRARNHGSGGAYTPPGGRA